MRQRLFIRLRSRDAAAQWVSVDAPGAVSPAAEGSLQEAAAAAAGSEVVVLVPGDQVLLCSAVVPSRNRHRVAEALPFALEDQLIDDVEDLHFAQGERGADGRVYAAIVARDHMDRWLNDLHEAGIRPAALIPDVLAVPFAEDQWTLVIERDISLLRTSRQDGFAFDTRNINTMLPAALASAGDEPPGRLRVIACGEGADFAAAGLTVDIPADTEPRPGPALEVLAGGYQEKGLNLLQGDYSRQEQLGRLWRPWRPAAALVLVWLCIQAGIAVYEFDHLKHRARELQQDVVQTFRRAFPEVHNIVNAKVQMQRRLDALRGAGGSPDTGFVGLLAEIGPELISDGSVQLKRLSYGNGKFDLAITIGDLQRLDALKQRLAKHPRFAVNIQSATSSSAGVEAQLQIKVKAS